MAGVGGVPLRNSGGNVALDKAQDTLKQLGRGIDNLGIEFHSRALVCGAVEATSGQVRIVCRIALAASSHCRSVPVKMTAGLPSMLHTVTPKRPLVCSTLTKSTGSIV